MKQIKLLLILLILPFVAMSQGTTPPATQQSITPSWFRTNSTDSNFYARVGTNTWYRFPTWEKVNSIFGNYYSKTVSDARFAPIGWVTSGGETLQSVTNRGNITPTGATFGDLIKVLGNFTTINRHAFEDYSTINTITDTHQGYASVDLFPQWTGSGVQSHYVGMQVRPYLGGTLSFEDYVYGLRIFPNITSSGAIENYAGLNIDNVSGNIVSKYGIKIGDISGGSAQNWALYTGNGGIRLGGDTFITNGARLFINTSSGSDYLNVNGGSSLTGDVTIDGVVRYKDSGATKIAHSFPNANEWKTESTSGVGMSWSPSGVEAMRLSSIGYLGVGTDTPIEKVEVNGNVKATNFIGASITQTAGDNSTKLATTAYADAKVQNNLTVSTTVAPSATAVNTGLALKANLSGGNTFSGNQVINGFVNFADAGGSTLIGTTNPISGGYNAGGLNFRNTLTTTSTTYFTTIKPNESQTTNIDLQFPNISGVLESTANKQNSLTTDGTGIKFPTVDAVNTGLGLKQNLVTLTTTGIGAATFNQGTGSLNIPIGGSGTVTNVSTSNGIGILGGVTNPTTTPAISLRADTTFLLTKNAVQSMSTKIVNGGMLFVSSSKNVSPYVAVQSLAGRFAFVNASAGTQYALSMATPSFTVDRIATWPDKNITVAGLDDIPISTNYLASGNGSSTTISIAHGLSGITSTSKALYAPRNAASAGILYYTLDATNINLFYTVAPVSGTNNLNYTISITP